ncbi:MAG: P27 family phage terminase small subunit [Clostridium perfringens]
MARPKKPIEMSNQHISKEQRERRENAELELVGDRDKLLEIPEDLNEDEALIYKRLIDDMIHIKALQNSDRIIFKTLAQTEYKIYLCEQEIKERGMFIDEMDRYGNLKRIPNPAIKVQKELLVLLKSYFSEIGLSASSRIKLAEVKEEEKSESKLDNILSSLRS